MLMGLIIAETMLVLLQQDLFYIFDNSIFNNVFHLSPGIQFSRLFFKSGVALATFQSFGMEADLTDKLHIL